MDDSLFCDSNHYVQEEDYMSEAEMYKERAEACRTKARLVMRNAKKCIHENDEPQFRKLIKEVEALLDEGHENMVRANRAIDEEIAYLDSIIDGVMHGDFKASMKKAMDEYHKEP
jgi:hypothetical protein